MAKEEFSVNELEPDRNTLPDEVATQKKVPDATLIKHESNVDKDTKVVEEEYEGPTIKEVLVNSINPDYEGPTAREIIVNSVKVDDTKKKNYVALFVLIFVLVSVGIIVAIDTFDDNNNKKNTDYLKYLPDWSIKYHTYLKERYQNDRTIEIAFVDFDRDSNAEVIVKVIDDENRYEVFDITSELETKVVVEDLNNILLVYSFDDKDVTWLFNTSHDSTQLNLIDMKKRLLLNNDYDIQISNDELSDFKSNHFILTYDIEYTSVNFRTFDSDYAKAVKLYEDAEKEYLENLTNKVIEQYENME